MADKRQSKQEHSQNSARGGQAVVSLCKVSRSGLTFWSRQRFDLVAELQVRVRIEVLPHDLRDHLPADEGGWTTVRGFVVECRATRRSDGAAVFLVSLVLDTTLVTAARRDGAHPPRLEGTVFGWN